MATIEDMTRVVVEGMDGIYITENLLVNVLYEAERRGWSWYKSGRKIWEVGKYEIIYPTRNEDLSVVDMAHDDLDYLIIRERK
jgi:hypothetical protein